MKEAHLGLIIISVAAIIAGTFGWVVNGYRMESSAIAHGHAYYSKIDNSFHWHEKGDLE